MQTLLIVGGCSASVLSQVLNDAGCDTLIQIFLVVRGEEVRRALRYRSCHLCLLVAAKRMSEMDIAIIRIIVAPFVPTTLLFESNAHPIASLPDDATGQFQPVFGYLKRERLRLEDRLGCQIRKF